MDRCNVTGRSWVVLGSVMYLSAASGAYQKNWSVRVAGSGPELSVCERLPETAACASKAFSAVCAVIASDSRSAGFFLSVRTYGLLFCGGIGLFFLLSGTGELAGCRFAVGACGADRMFQTVCGRPLSHGRSGRMCAGLRRRCGQLWYRIRKNMEKKAGCRQLNFRYLCTGLCCRCGQLCRGKGT